MTRVRVALCQLESHPAIQSSHINYLGEPFLPNSVSLSALGSGGLDIHELQSRCEKDYLAWQDRRLEGVLSFLTTVSPPPDIVLFPECSIPISSLPRIGAWSAKTGATVLAGTHTPLRSVRARRTYTEIGVKKKALDRIASKYRSKNVLPLFRSGKIDLVPKRLSSPFEENVVAPGLPALPSLSPFQINLGSDSLSLLPVICSEALQIHNVSKPYELVGLIAFDTKPSQFNSYLGQQVRNRKAVLFVNDGSRGGSRLATNQDKRREDWLADSFPGGLPIGEAILVADLDTSVGAVEVGTAIPRQAYTLVLLSAVSYESSGSSGAHPSLLSINSIRDSAARAAELRRLLQSKNLSAVVRKKAEHLQVLESRGVDSTSWWTVLGRDLVIAGLPSLRELESNLAAHCMAGLIEMAGSPATEEPTVASAVMNFLSTCKRRARGREGVPEVTPSRERSLAIIDRESEVRVVHEFLDHSALSFLEVNGLQEIGKSSVLHRAFAESGAPSPLEITFTETSSIDFLLWSLLQRSPGPPQPPYSDPLSLCAQTVFENALRSVPVLVLHNAHLLLQHGNWRDERWPGVLGVLLRRATELGIKIIIETRRQLPLVLANPTSRSLLHVRGFTRDRAPVGVALFDAQLRRVGLSPSEMDDEKKLEVVRLVGGHPIAVALAADAAYTEGIDSLLNSLRSRKGSILNFIERLVRSLELSDDEVTLMKLLGLARRAVPREVVYGSVDFPANAALVNLVALGAVEVQGDTRIETADVLRRYFDSRELPAELTTSFHKSAARVFRAIAEANPADLSAAVETEYHAGLAGVQAGIVTNLIDGALATARKLFEDQRYDEASTVTDSLLNTNRSTEVLSLAAQIEARRGKFDTALPLAKTVLSRNPRDPWLLAELAKTALTQHQERAAEQLIQIARDTGIEDVSVLIVEGRLALRQKNLVAAEKAFRRAKSQTERNPWPYYYLGRTYMLLGRIDSAIDTLHSGEEFYYEKNCYGRSALSAIRTQLGLAYYFAERYDLARQIIEGLVEEDPSPEVLRVFAALTIKEEGISEAHEVLKRLGEAKKRTRTDRAQFHLLYGQFCLGIDDKARASREFRKAYEADRGNVFIMMNWARTLFDLAVERHLESDVSYEAYIRDCSHLVRRILRFDEDNEEGIKLLVSLRQRFGADV